MKSREPNGTNDIVYGVHTITGSLTANTGDKLCVQGGLRGKDVDRMKNLTAGKKVPIPWTSKETLSDMTDGATHQGFVLRVSEFAYAELNMILDKAAQEGNPLVSTLSRLDDPYNFGLILRIVDATNVTDIIASKHRAVGVTPIAVKTSTGAVEHVPVTRVTNLSRALDKLKKQDFWVFGIDMSRTPFHKWDASGKSVLIIGNEGKDTSRNVKKQVDEMTIIPINDHIQSLNASTIAAVLICEVFRRRTD